MVVYTGYGQIDINNDDFKQIKDLKDKAYKTLRDGDTLLFKELNDKLFKLSSNIRDTTGLAEYHWNNAVFFKDKEVMDSAYFNYGKAEEYYNIVKDTSLSAKMLFNMAFIRGRLRDYTGGEVLLFEAIAKYESLDNDKSLYGCYNRLGLFYTELSENEKAIFYFDKALEYLNKVDDKGILLESTFNNIGLVYQKSGNYSEAIEYYKKALENHSLKETNSGFYAKLLDNHAYSRFLSGDSTNVKSELLKSLAIRDSFNNKSGIVISKVHIADYYAFFEDTLLAIENVKEANALAKAINNSRDYLVSLKLLSKLDKPNSQKYLLEYVSISDSLQIEERRVRNKFMRISYETNKYIEETERLSQKNFWTIIIGLTSLLVLLLLYFLKQQRSRNRELIFEAKQRNYNEEIYKLMLKQQTNLKKGRLEERNRISEELHDGVLSKLFGTRLGMGFLKLEGDGETLKEYKSFINELQQVEKEIRTISHELKNDLIISELSFINLIENLVENQSSLGNYNYSLNSDKNINWDDIDEMAKIHFYRIIQEALSNIVKYSKAENVGIYFELTDNILTLKVQDDGVGFDISKSKKGIGLQNMYSRMQKLKGEFVMDSRLGHGTTISVSINTKPVDYATRV